jgi:hypothetical protein
VIAIHRVSVDTVVPAGATSDMYFVTTAPGNVTITLPRASLSKNRFITVRRADGGRRVIVQTVGSDPLDGGRDPIVMNNKGDYVTLTCDGVEWFIFAQQQ